MNDLPTHEHDRGHRIPIREIVSAAFLVLLIALLAVWPAKKRRGVKEQSVLPQRAALDASTPPSGSPKMGASELSGASGTDSGRGESNDQARRVTPTRSAADDTTGDWQRYLEMTRTALERSPGYVRPYDPEWRSVVRGRRDAPEISMPLAGGASSLEGLASAILDAASRKDLDALRALQMTEEEFATIVWPELPQSRPITRALASDAWILMEGDMVSGIDGAIAECAGRSLTLLDAKVEKTEEFRNFTLYRHVTFEVRDANGKTETMKRIADAVERKGRFKVMLFEE